jgi:hypothetical protein
MAQIRRADEFLEFLLRQVVHQNRINLNASDLFGLKPQSS